MTRREFPARVRAAVIKRCMDPQGVIRCEQCSGVAKRFQIDHIRPDGLLGEPVIENAQLLCEQCFMEKNAEDASTIAKAKRREAYHTGAKLKSKRPLQSAGFRKAPPQNHASTPVNKWIGYRKDGI